MLVSISMTENPRFIKQEGALAEPPVSSGGTLRPSSSRSHITRGFRGERRTGAGLPAPSPNSERSACGDLRQAFQRTATGPPRCRCLVLLCAMVGMLCPECRENVGLSKVGKEIAGFSGVWVSALVGGHPRKRRMAQAPLDKGTSGHFKDKHT